MAGRNGRGESLSPSSRKQDRSIDDALRTMERLAWWLETAREQNAWQQAEDAVQIAMLHGMLEHLRKEIDAFIAQGGDEVQETVRAFRAIVSETTP